MVIYGQALTTHFPKVKEGRGEVRSTHGHLSIGVDKTCPESESGRH